MTDQGRRFCPRCGTALVADLPFCPACGRNSADVGDRSPAPPNVESEASADVSTRDDERPIDSGVSTSIRRLVDRGSRLPPVVIGALIVAVGLVVFGLLMRPQSGGNPGGTPGGQQPPGPSVVDASALIVGLTIESPLDGQAVATKDVTVIGIAPPGLKITRDVSFGLDQHATSDGTGHWAMSVSLNDGDNRLKFRIGDDRSTEKEIHVTYRP